MNIRFTGLIFTLLFAGLTFEIASENKILSRFTLRKSRLSSYFIKTYDCTYAGLWCSCYTNNKGGCSGGCSVGCSPSTYKTLYNQTSCPQIEDFILAGFKIS